MHPDLQHGYYGFVLGVLAVWRVSHLLHVEDGPFRIFARGRAAATRLGLGEVFQCFFCLSLWVAMPVGYWLAATWPMRVLTWLALSAAAIVIEVRVLGGPAHLPEQEE